MKTTKPRFRVFARANTFGLEGTVAARRLAEQQQRRGALGYTSGMFVAHGAPSASSTQRRLQCVLRAEGVTNIQILTHNILTPIATH